MNTDPPRSPEPPGPASPPARRRTTTRLLLAGLVLALVAAASVAVTVRLLRTDPVGLDRALDLVPADTARYSWTDWTGVRRELGLDLDADSPGSAVESLLDRGFDADLTSSSVLVTSAVAMQGALGFSPATLDWELYAQSTQGAVLAMGLPADADVDAIATALEESGYTPPADDRTSGGMWTGGDAVRVELGDITPELSYLSIDATESLIVSSSTALGWQTARDAAGDGENGEDGDGGDGTGAAPGVHAAADQVGTPLSASLYTGDQACSELAMSGADPAEAAAADQLIAAAGKVNPMVGYAIAAEPDGDVRVAMAFENDEQARTNADTRSRLAVGPAPGQGGDFGDRFALGRVTAEGSVVTMELKPVDGAYLLSDLSTGPVLFATC